MLRAISGFVPNTYSSQYISSAEQDVHLPPALKGLEPQLRMFRDTYSDRDVQLLIWQGKPTIEVQRGGKDMEIGTPGAIGAGILEIDRKPVGSFQRFATRNSEQHVVAIALLSKQSGPPSTQKDILDAHRSERD